MEPKYKKGQEIEYLAQRQPDVWVKAIIQSLTFGKYSPYFYIVKSQSTGLVTSQSESNIRPVVKS